MKINQKGFSAVEILAVIIVLAIIGAAGTVVMMRNNDNKGATPSETTQANQTSRNAQDQPATKDSLTEGQMKYEKIFYKYPSSWSIKDESYVLNSVTSSNQPPGGDKILLTAPSGLRVKLETGICGGTRAGEALTDKVTVLGAEYHLGYPVAKGQTPNPDAVSGVYVVSNGSTILTGRNLPCGLAKARMGFSIEPSSSTASVASIQSDVSYKEAVTILESLTY